MALRESIDVRRDALVPGLSPLGSLAMMTPVGCMWRVYSSGLCIWIVMSLFSVMYY